MNDISKREKLSYDEKQQQQRKINTSITAYRYSQGERTKETTIKKKMNIVLIRHFSKPIIERLPTTTH